MNENERKTLIICFSTDHLSAGAFLRSFKDDNVFLRFDHLRFEKEYQAGERLLMAIIHDVPEYKDKNIERMVFIIDRSVSNYIDEFDSGIFMEIMETCPIKVPTYFYFEDKCISCKETYLDYPVYFNGFDREEVLARRFIYEFKKEYIVKSHLEEVNFYFINASDYSCTLLKHLLCDTYSPLMKESYHLNESLNVIVENVKKVSALSMINIDNNLSIKNNAFVFIDNEDLSTSIEQAKVVNKENPEAMIFIHSKEERNSIGKNIKFVSFYKYGYRYFFDREFIINFNHFLDAQLCYPDYLNGLGIFFVEKEDEHFLLSNTDNPSYFFNPYLIRAVNYLSKIDVKNDLLEFNNLKNEPSILYEWLVNQYEKDTALSRLANLEHIRWMMRSFLILRNYRGKEVYFRPLNDLVTYFNSVAYISLNQQFETDKIVYDYCNALMALILFK